MKLSKKLDFAKEPTFVFGGNLLSQGFGLLSLILLTRVLGPKEYGYFSVAVAVMWVVSQLSDMGISLSLIRLASYYLRRDKEKANLLFNISLRAKLVIGIIVVIVGLFMIDPLFDRYLKRPDLITPLKFSLLGIFALSLWGYVVSYLRARQWFLKYACLNVVFNLSKFILVAILVIINKANLYTSLSAYITSSLLGVVVGSLIIPKDFLKAKGNTGGGILELLSLSKWIAISSFSVLLANNLGVFMLTKYARPEVVGIYTAALRLSLLFPIIIDSLTTVLLPKISELETVMDAREYVRKSLRLSLIGGFLILPLFFASSTAIRFVYGDLYLQAASIFQVMVLSSLFVLITEPLGLIAFFFNSPQLLTLFHTGQLFLLFIGYCLLIPHFGAMGAAFGALFAKIISLGLMGWYLYLVLYREEGGFFNAGQKERKPSIIGKPWIRWSGY